MTKRLRAGSAMPRTRRVRGFGLIAVLLLCAGLLSACETGTPILTGVAEVGGLDESPAFNAPVRVYSDTSETLVAETTVNIHGTFRFTTDMLSPGTYRVRIGAEWWSSTSTAESWEEAESLVVDGDGATDIYEALQLKNVTAGMLTTETEPVAGLLVFAVRASDNVPVGIATTGDDGSYWINLWDTSSVKIAYADPLGRYAPKFIGADDPTVYDGTSAGIIDVTTGLPTVMRILDVTAAATHSCVIALFDHNVHCSDNVGYPQHYVFDGPYLAVEAGGGADGDTITCALRADDGRIDCEGSAKYGEDIPPADTAFSDIDLEKRTMCGVVLGGASIECWGYLSYVGQTDTLDAPPGEQFVSVAAGEEHFCGLTDEGNIVCEGDDTYGQFLTTPEGGATAIAAGEFHTCAIDASQQIVCSGWEYEGSTTPPTGDYTQLDLGGNTGCALSTTGAIACWGDGAVGQTSPPAGTYTDLSVAISQGCAITPEQTVACWGMAVAPPNTF